MNPTVIEQAIVARLEAAFPGLPVRGDHRSLDHIRESGVLRPPEIHVLCQEWKPPRDGFGQSGGFQVWKVRLLVAEQADEESLRRGDLGLHALSSALHDALAGKVMAEGLSPLVSDGGSLSRAGDSFVAWEAEFLISPPASNAVRPVMARTVVRVATLTSAWNMGVLTKTLPPGTGSALLVGDTLAVSNESSAHCEFLGAATAVSEDTVTVERAPSRDFPAASLLHRFGEAHRFPVTPAPGSLSKRFANSGIDGDLAGSLHRIVLGGTTYRLKWRFSPVAAEQANSLDSWFTIAGEGVPMFVGTDAGVFIAHLDEEPEFRELGGKLSDVLICLLAWQLDSPAEWELSP